MKKLLLSISVLTGLILPALAQNNAGKNTRGNRVEALKIAFLTRKLDLSPEEAQRFWPIYNEYAAEIKNARKDQRQQGVSELDTEEKVLSIRKKYNAEFTKALNKEKADTFFQAEKEFSAFVQKELMERRQKRQQENKQRTPDNR